MLVFFLYVGLSMVQEGVLIVDGPYTTNALKGSGVTFSVDYQSCIMTSSVTPIMMSTSSAYIMCTYPE